ncbi:Phytanoyl-CoA dioxygenase (PhyH) [Maioricimonas rarisocia]|uniref:Phytanoyl-CoA dioxygenase (PhyH) n=1 Tax=Maioricimonas rarisocia TaxID=2528026 RepID=A0A517Z0A0_9PLAN|nr:phytanoyl-CoA dioxygenase family protein [Maioricimonas rarisocia]QDU35908.1 Phytanoyl-CoA dioxygenase (PhyH) [Maioricimonas rarisocia]
MTDSDWLRTLEHDGCVMLRNVLDASEIAAMTSALDAAFRADAETSESVRQRSGQVYAVRNVLTICPDILRLWRHPRLVGAVHGVLGRDAGLVRGLFFDKPPDQTWALPWHKDLTIAVRDRPEGSPPGYSPLRRRAGVPHCEPPLEVLESMLTLRIHLDAMTEANGPLEVLPGSHRTGKQLRIDDFDPVTLHAAAGDVLLMRPLLAHCSGKSRPATGQHRRILHLEFAAGPQLAGGLGWSEFHPVTAGA